MNIQQIVAYIIPYLISVFGIYVALEKKLAVQEVMIKQLTEEVKELKIELKELKK